MKILYVGILPLLLCSGIIHAMNHTNPEYQQTAQICAICSDYVRENGTKLNCSHKLHKECYESLLESAVAADKEFTCPQCTSNVGAQDEELMQAISASTAEGAAQAASSSAYQDEDLIRALSASEAEAAAQAAYQDEELIRVVSASAAEAASSAQQEEELIRVVAESAAEAAQAAASSAQTQTIDSNQSGQCEACLDEINDKVTTACKHAFCSNCLKACIQTYMINNQQPKCPALGCGKLLDSSLVPARLTDEQKSRLTQSVGALALAHSQNDHVSNILNDSSVSMSDRAAIIAAMHD